MKIIILMLLEKYYFIEDIEILMKKIMMMNI